MSNGSEACCALGICCPPAEQRQSVMRLLVEDTGCDETTAGKMADSMLGRFALAPKSLTPFVNEVIAMIKAHG